MKRNFTFEELVGTAIKEYRLEYLIEQNDLGAIFLARCPDIQQMYQFRMLNGSGFSPEEQHVYTEQFQQEASKIAALQHPAIHPLLEYGDHNGMPYLISSYIPPHLSLATHLKTSGPLDMVEAGNYMDMLTSALEYAHLQAIMHGNLTPDSIFIIPASSSESPSIIVADIGVAGLQRLSEQNDRQGSPPIWRLSPDGEIGDPKHYCDGPLTPANDTSALGAILYQMLTGYSVLDSKQKEHAMGELSGHTQASHALFSRRKALSLIVATSTAVASTGIVWANQRSGANIASSLPAFAQQEMSSFKKVTPTQTSISLLASPTDTIIARTSSIPINSSFAFKVPQNGNPGVLIHLPSNSFVAFDAVCTHEGCTVAYNAKTMLIECPCHGSLFDPTRNAAVVHGPAHTPLAAVQMTVNADGTITTVGAAAASTLACSQNNTVSSSTSKGGGDNN